DGAGVGGCALGRAIRGCEPVGDGVGRDVGVIVRGGVDDDAMRGGGVGVGRIGGTDVGLLRNDTDDPPSRTFESTRSSNSSIGGIAIDPDDICTIGILSGALHATSVYSTACAIRRPMSG